MAAASGAVAEVEAAASVDRLDLRLSRSPAGVGVRTASVDGVRTYRPRGLLLLLDHGHVFHVLRGVMTFPDVVERIRRHASQTGEGYLSVAEFGNG